MTEPFDPLSQEAQDHLTFLEHHLDDLIDYYRASPTYRAASDTARLKMIIDHLSATDMTRNMAVFTLAICFHRVVETLDLKQPPEHDRLEW